MKPNVFVHSRFVYVSVVAVTMSSNLPQNGCICVRARESARVHEVI